MTQEELHVIELIFRSIEVLAVISGGAAILVKMGRMMGSFEMIGKQQALEIGNLKDEVKELTVLVTAVAVQKVELASLREEISLLRKWYDELRHGQGYVQLPPRGSP